MIVDGLKTSQNTTVEMDSVGGYWRKACNDGGSGRVCRRTPRYRILPQFVVARFLGLRGYAREKFGFSMLLGRVDIYVKLVS